jgi:UDP-3-O-[3-hydroxymyristoyl] glucosamine N-acyltransferase
MGMLEFPTTAGKIAAYFNATLLGDPKTPVEGLNSVKSASGGSLCFLSDKKSIHFLQFLETGAVVLTKKEFVREDLSLTYILVDEPKVAFAQVAKSFMPKSQWKGISNKADIHPKAQVDPLAHIGPFAVVCEGAKVGPHTVVHPHAYIGPGVQVGAQCEIYPQAVLLVHVFIGNRVRVLSGSVLGSDGFGLIEGAQGHLEMPQVGKVVVEDDVRIGAHCTIDRGTLGETRIGQGSKLDDQVHVGHNCLIGKNSILCAQVGLAGSSILEEGVVLAGQVGVGDHITIGKGARVGGQTGVTANLKGGETYFSTPAMPLRQALRSHVYFRDLPDLAERIKVIEKEIHGNSKS